MNDIEDLTGIDKTCFSFADLLGIDRWNPFTVSTSIFVSGAPSNSGRYKFVGKQCYFQASLAAATSVSTSAGTHYLALPAVAKGLGGDASMTNANTKVAVGNCHIDAATSRCYLPTQAATSNTMLVNGWFEVG